MLAIILTKVVSCKREKEEKLFVSIKILNSDYDKSSKNSSFFIFLSNGDKTKTHKWEVSPYIYIYGP